jgi:hypothetical protein
MGFDLLVEIRVWSQKLFDGTAFSAPLLSRIVANISREEAIIREQFPSIAWG